MLHQRATSGPMSIVFACILFGRGTVIRSCCCMASPKLKRLAESAAGASSALYVIAPDLRGCGASDRPETGYDRRTVAEDVHQLVQQLRLGPRPPPVSVIRFGHSDLSCRLQQFRMSDTG